MRPALALLAAASLFCAPALAAEALHVAATPAPTATPSEPPAHAPKPGEYSPGGTCSCASGELKVTPTGKDIVGAATCRSAVERALRPKVCDQPDRKPVAFTYAYKATEGTGKIYCR